MTLLVIGTTVTTPRPRRAAVVLARSLLTTTAGRLLLASLPRDGSKSTCQISPRSIAEPVGGGDVPLVSRTARRRLRPCVAVVVLEVWITQHPDSCLDCG